MVRLFCSQPLILLYWIVPGYDCKTQQNTTLTGQEIQGEDQ